MKIEGKEYRTIWFEKNLLKIIDQTKLPHKFIIKELKTLDDAVNAIKTMEVKNLLLEIANTIIFILEMRISKLLKDFATKS